MTEKEISLNLSNGNKVNLRAKLSINELKDEEKVLFNIFDCDNDGILSKKEFANVKAFSAGIFSVEENKNHTKVSYVEDLDCNDKPEYTSRWILDEKGRIIDRTKDDDGDDIIDVHISQTYGENGELTGELEENFEKGELVYSYAVVTKDGETLVRTVGLKHGEKMLDYTMPKGWSLKRVENAFKELDGQSDIK